MGDTASYIVITEDVAGARFVEQYLRARGVGNRDIHTTTAPPGQGSAKTWVTQRYASELRRHRRKASHTKKTLIICSDADQQAVGVRRGELEAAVHDAQLEPRAKGERVLLIVPKWEIETWAHHLLTGQGAVEDKKVGWRSPESELKCHMAGKSMTEHRKPPSVLPPCCPPSMVAADAEFLRLG